MRTILVTGASGNLGHALVQQFTTAGDRVCGTGQPPVETAGYEGEKVDLMQEEAAGAWVGHVIEKYQTIDSAILTVGGFAMGGIRDTTLGMLEKQIQLNFHTAYTVGRPVFLQLLKQGRGTMFFIGSEAGLNVENNKGVIAYGLAKSLLFRLAALMNEEAAGTAVKIFVVVPHIIDTPQNRAAMPEAVFGSWQTPAYIAGRIQAAMDSPMDTPAVLIC